MRNQQHFAEEDTHNDPNLEVEVNNYDLRDFNRKLDDIEDLDWQQKIKKIVFLFAIGLVAAFVLFGLIHVLFGGKQTTPAAPTDPKKPPSTGHKQEAEWITDINQNKYQILGVYARSSIHFTQGLYMEESTMVESGGLYGQSTIQYLEIDEAGQFINLKKKVEVPSNYFAEGCDMITVNNEKSIYQLTWKENKIFKYDTDLKLVKTFDKPSQLAEGWGITHDPAAPCSFIISDSTSVLHTVNCETMAVESSLPVKKNGYPLNSMNELEFVEDYLLSNVWLAKSIEIIDMKTGNVVRSLDMSVLIDKANAERIRRNLNYLEYGECLNGIAYDWKNKVLWLTGKNWPLFFKIKLPEEYLKRPAN